MSPINSNRKGSNFERKIAKEINEMFGTNVRRTPNSGGLSIKGDIIATSGTLSEYHWELKNQEKLNIWKALHQSRSDRGSRIPLVVFTKNLEADYVALELGDFLNIVKELEDLKETINELKKLNPDPIK